MEIICFAAGILLIYTHNALAFFFLLAVLLFRAYWTIVLAFLIGMLWAIIHQYWYLDQGMPVESIVNNAHIQGYVISIPTITSTKTQFQFAADRLNNRPIQSKISIDCYKNCPHFQVGEYWHLNAKLHRGRNLLNPGGFDYVGWLAARHIHWIGQLIPKSASLQPDVKRRYPLLRLRERMAHRLSILNLDQKTLGIWEALTLGITTHIDKSSWDLFRKTGTTHLMVISGAHIGLIAGLSYQLVKWLWCRTGQICLSLPAQKIASMAGIFMALIYASLAGFAVPAERSLCACIFLFLSNLGGQRFSGWQAWRYGLLLVLIIEPHAVSLPGFYLSFLAVAILFAMNQRVNFKGIRKNLSIQLACLFGLMPLTLFWFSYGSVNGLIANLLAIPWVSFILVPLALFTALVGQLISVTWLVMSLKYATLGLFYYLQWVDSLAWVNLSWSYNQIIGPLALMIAMIILVFMPILYLMPAAIVLIIAGLFPGHSTIPKGEAQIDVLDVGQGLSIVIRTAKHVLIYDTGMQFYQGSDMGKLALIPYLHSLIIPKTIDKVIISHPDLDHRGGLASLEEAYQVNELIVDNPQFYHRGESCHHYVDWDWDDIHFHFFPIQMDLKSKNNTSCVLQVSNLSGKVLLTGDIERLAEDYLTATYGKTLQSTVMIVPHHGSKTSSSNAFLSQVAPRYAIVSYGFNNRYHFPHTQAMRNYQTKNIAIYNTVESGMISIRLKKTL